MLDADVPQMLIRTLDVGIHILVAPDAEGRAARSDLVLLGDVVPVEVGPGARIERGKRGVVVLGEARPLTRHVDAPVSLDSRLAVAEQIEGAADARHHVVPVRRIGDRVEVLLPHEPAGGLGLCSGSTN